MEKRITLYAEEGKMLTDGEHFGKIVYLSADSDASAWHEITMAEYEKIIKAKEENAEHMGG